MEELNEKREIKDQYEIEWSAKKVASSLKTKDVEINISIRTIIDFYGQKSVYLGKTCDPYGRMKGKYNINESEIFKDFEDEISPHNVPHIENGYTLMFILYESDNPMEIKNLEKRKIKLFKNEIRNQNKGGGGKNGSPPYFLYAVVHGEAVNEKS